MSAKNYTIHNNDPEVLKDYAEQYESMGRETKIEGNKLTVFMGKRPVEVSKKKKFTRRPRPARD